MRLAQQGGAAPAPLHLARVPVAGCQVRAPIGCESMNRNASMWTYPVVHAGGEFVGTLIEADLIDEFHLIIHPVVLGSGKRLSPTVLRSSEVINARVDLDRSTVRHLCQRPAAPTRARRRHSKSGDEGPGDQHCPLPSPAPPATSDASQWKRYYAEESPLNRSSPQVAASKLSTTSWTKGYPYAAPTTWTSVPPPSTCRRRPASLVSGTEVDGASDNTPMSSPPGRAAGVQLIAFTSIVHAPTSTLRIGQSTEPRRRR